MIKILYRDGHYSPAEPCGPLLGLYPITEDEIEFFYRRYDELMGPPEISLNESCEETLEKDYKKSKEIKAIIKAEILQMRIK